MGFIATLKNLFKFKKKIKTRKNKTRKNKKKVKKQKGG